ncbi:hypothetical protein PEBR_16050 [Penicillium brasilianum]|uniref:Uncharacterized protein n=1 Tax=Penicillium brasilianum TaxID=104259 RepID=A0A1S9RQ74_PENBI|nr:hypothetical protein PEBR_16050 [Penicillium brasilianum]
MAAVAVVEMVVMTAMAMVDVVVDVASTVFIVPAARAWDAGSRESDHRHDCPRNRQRGGLQSNGGQDVRQWLNNVHTQPGQVVFSYLFGPSRQGNLVWHAPRNNHTIHLATMQIQLQLQSQQLMQQQLSLQMQLQQNLLMQQRVLEQQQQRPARPVLQLQNGATQEGHQQDHQQDHQEDQIDDNVDFA